MKRLAIRHILVISLAMAQFSGVSFAGPNTSDIDGAELLMQSGKVKKAQKKQDAKEREKKKAIKEGSKESQKRTYEIQSPEVQARMKQNKKNATARDKAKRKNNKERTRRGAKKYK